MARQISEFKNDGITAGLSYAVQRDQDISTAVTLITAPSVSTQSIVITDIVFSTTLATNASIQDNNTIILDLRAPANGSVSVNLSGPLKLTAGNALKVKLSTSSLAYCIFCTYYIQD